MLVSSNLPQIAKKSEAVLILLREILPERPPHIFSPMLKVPDRSKETNMNWNQYLISKTKK